MSKAITRPWDSEYTITQTLVLAETPDLRVIDLTLAPGECVPCQFPIVQGTGRYDYKGLPKLDAAWPSAKEKRP